MGDRAIAFALACARLAITPRRFVGSITVIYLAERHRRQLNKIGDSHPTPRFNFRRTAVPQ
jgi:hypothetical protein